MSGQTGRDFHPFRRGQLTVGFCGGAATSGGNSAPAHSGGACQYSRPLAYEQSTQDTGALRSRSAASASCDIRCARRC